MSNKWDDIAIDELDQVEESFWSTMPEKVALRVATFIGDSKNHKKGKKGYTYEASDSLSPVLTEVSYKRLKNMFVPKLLDNTEWKSYWQLRYDQFPYLEAECFLQLMDSAGIAPEEKETPEDSIL